MTASLTSIEDGQKRGIDPRTLGAEELEAAGIERRPVLDAIRAKCLDCCCGMRSEVAACSLVNCALWPFRMSTNPFRAAREMSAEQRAAAGERLAAARAARVAQ